MSNGSPTAYLLWAILSCIFFGFLLGRLWAYDRFNCLKWDAGRQPGAFKRVMTYSYVATLPLLVFFSVTITALKFKEGFFNMPSGEIIPRPFMLWEPNNKHWLLPLYFILSVGWSLELVTHLEELAFWLFLLHQGPGKDDWFHSWEFRMWCLGSVVAVVGMPLTVFVSRKNLELVLAWIFLAGSSAGTSTTVCFLYVLARFPGFLQHVKKEGAKPDVVVRLTTFYNLNKARVVFRFLYTIPLLIIAIDAVQGTHPVVGSPFALDFLLMMGGIGCFISSAITILIFFPRPISACEYDHKTENISLRDSAGERSTYNNYENHKLCGPKTQHLHEDAAEAHLRSFRYPVKHPIRDSVPLDSAESQEGKDWHSGEGEISPGYESDAESIASSPAVLLTRNPSTGASRPIAGGRSDDPMWRGREEPSTIPRRLQSPDGPSLFSRPRKVGVAIFGRGGISTSEEEGGGLSSDAEREPSQLHPYVINFTSPIDLSDQPPQDPRLHVV